MAGDGGGTKRSRAAARGSGGVERARPPLCHPGVAPGAPDEAALASPQLLLPSPGDPLDILECCPEQNQFGGAGWLWEASEDDLQFHTVSLQPRQPVWALKNPLFSPSG